MHKKEQRIAGKRIYLRPLMVEDVTQKYVDWLNDSEVNRFLSVKGKTQNIDLVKKYVLSYAGDKNRLLLGIFTKEEHLHIGNITFSSINMEDRVGVVGIAIGDKKYWGRGYAAEALALAIDFAFGSLGMKRLEAGVSKQNLPSQKLFSKLGFKPMGNKHGLIAERLVLWF